MPAMTAAPAARTTPTVPAPGPGPAKSRWEKVVDLLVRYRVRITIIVFVILLSEDVLTGIKPHDLTNIRDMKTVIGCSLVAVGLALRSWAAGMLRKDAQLTTSGPYGIIRNPLYVGSFLLMIGFCTLVDDPENIWFVLGPFLVLYIMKVSREERRLSRIFGDQWQSYVRSVPRFLPRRLPSLSFADWSLSRWLGNREYRAVSAVFLGLVALQLWHLYRSASPVL